MAKYVDWDGYRQMYPDGLSEEEFGRYADRAEAMIDIWTAGRAQNAQDWAAGQVKMAVYALVGLIAQRGGVTGGARLVSVSSDGYSEQYRAEDGEGEMKAEVMRWLSGTGLVSAL